MEAVNYRVRVIQRNEAQIAPPTPLNSEPRLERGVISLSGERQGAVFAERSSLPPGFSLEGPAVIEEETATAVVPGGWRLAVGAEGDMMIER